MAVPIPFEAGPLTAAQLNYVNGMIADLQAGQQPSGALPITLLAGTTNDTGTTASVITVGRWAWAYGQLVGSFGGALTQYATLPAGALPVVQHFAPLQWGAGTSVVAVRLDVDGKLNASLVSGTSPATRIRFSTLYAI